MTTKEMGAQQMDMDLLKEGVKQKFAEVRAALHIREKLLLRQLDVIATSQQQQQMGRGDNNGGTSAKEIQFLAEQEEQLFATIRTFGRFQLDNMNFALQDVYLRNEDYIAPIDDHETMYKCLQQQQHHQLLEASTMAEEEQPEAIVVDFSRNKSLIEHNTRHMNESIINITLQEAKELIRRAQMRRETPIPPLNLEELNDELESSIAEAVSSLGGCESVANTKSSQTCVGSAKQGTKAKRNRCKPKITINNCNGTINLRNIASLTINCANEDAVSAEVPVQCTPVMNSNDGGDNKSNERDDDDTSTQYLSYAAQSKSQPAHAEDPSSTSSEQSNTPTTIASSSNYSSRAQSKKQKSGRRAHNSTSNDNSHSNSSTVSSTTLTSNATTPQATTSVYPYELVDDDDDIDEERNAATCDFYNRLLNEIKHSLREQTRRTGGEQTPTHYLVSSSGVGMAGRAQLPLDAEGNVQGAEQAEAVDSGGVSSTSNNINATTITGTAAGSTTTTYDANSNLSGRRLILKNFENLKIILEANSDEETFHPVQIEQWLAEIISETDLEPMQNTDILEHSRIHNEQQN